MKYPGIQIRRALQGKAFGLVEGSYKELTESRKSLEELERLQEGRESRTGEGRDYLQ